MYFAVFEAMKLGGNVREKMNYIRHKAGMSEKPSFQESSFPTAITMRFL
jgi:hypothetical protein